MDTLIIDAPYCFCAAGLSSSTGVWSFGTKYCLGLPPCGLCIWVFGMGLMLPSCSPFRVVGLMSPKTWLIWSSVYCWLFPV